MNYLRLELGVMASRANFTKETRAGARDVTGQKVYLT